MKNAALLSIVCSALAAPLLLGATVPRASRYAIDAAFFPDESRMKAEARVTLADAAPAAAITFYLHGELEVTSVRAAGTELSFEQEPVFYDDDYSLIANEVTVSTAGVDLRGGLEIAYSGHFHASGARSPSDYMRIDREGVFLRAYGYSLWFPTFLIDKQDQYAVCFDDVRISTPAAMRSVFVGRKVSESVEGDRRVSRWQAPDTTLFDAQCVAADFVTADQGRIHLYYAPDEKSVKSAAAVGAFTQTVVTAYATYYRKDVIMDDLHVVEMPEYGDISSGNVTGIRRARWENFEAESSCKRALAHELVHPFVRLTVDRSDPLYALAIEGIPSFFHLPVLAEVLGEDFYGSFMTHLEEIYLQQTTTGKHPRGWEVPTEKPLMEITPDEIGIYKDEFVLGDRAVLFFNYLYRTMGRQRFFQFAGKLFASERMSAREFEALVGEFLPDRRSDVHTWLWTNDYPERFRLDRVGQSGVKRDN